MRNTWPSVTGLAASANRQVGSSLRMVQGVISKSRMIITRVLPTSIGLVMLLLSRKSRKAQEVVSGDVGRLHRNAGGLDDRPPFVDLGRDIVTQLLGRPADRLHIKRLELLLPERALEIIVDRRVELRHHIARRAGGCRDAIPGDGL